MSVVDDICYALAYSVAFSLVGLGVFLSTKVFKIIDLTCESSFALGACVYGSMVLAGMSPVWAMLVSMFMGYVSGVITASLISYIRLNAIVAGLLTVGGVESLLMKLVEIKKVNPLSILGNLSATNDLILVVIIAGIIWILFYRFMSSEYGLSMRVYGDGEIITRSMGIDSERALSVGLGCENMMSALGGVLVAQIMGEFGPGIGNGCIIFGMSAIIIGEKLIESNNVKKAIIGVICGSIVIQFVLRIIMNKEFIGLGGEYSSVVMAIMLIMLVSIKQADLDYTNEGKKE